MWIKENVLFIYLDLPLCILFLSVFGCAIHYKFGHLDCLLSHEAIHGTTNKMGLLMGLDNLRSLSICIAENWDPEGWNSWIFPQEINRFSSEI